MTTGYVVQVDFPKGIKYLGQAGRLQTIPKFFLSAPTVKSYILSKQTGYGDARYDANRHSEWTKIITIRDLDKGMRDSRASVHFYGEWLENHAPGAKNKLINNPNAEYKIQLLNGNLVSFGPRSKFGKVWTRAGDVRSHITSHLGNHRLFTTTYNGAKVVEITHAKNGIDVLGVKYYPIEEFYRASPNCSKRLDDLNDLHVLTRTAYNEEYA